MENIAFFGYLALLWLTKLGVVRVGGGIVICLGAKLLFFDEHLALYGIPRGV